MNKIFKQQVYDLVAIIPEGRVMTYGQIAALCGSPGAARVVGQVAHFGAEDLPWHRVVNASGGMARGFWPGGPDGQGQLLMDEGVQVHNGKLKLEDYLWWPQN
jgi:methylated-DNA-protein-cysteine methyltransferase related protein